MTEDSQKWTGIEFDDKWLACDTSKFGDLAPAWYKRRQQIGQDEEVYNRFISQLKREHAIETGIIERLYDLKEGITETFIKEGFIEAYLHHDDTDISPSLLMNYLNDHIEAIDFIF